MPNDPRWFDILARLDREGGGRTREYKKYCQQLREHERINGGLAWKMAVQKFPPLDGSPSEIPSSDISVDVNGNTTARPTSDQKSRADKAHRALHRRSAALHALTQLVPSDRRASQETCILWAVRHLDVPYAAIQADDVPDRLGLSFLKIAGSSDDGLKWLLNQLAKVKPDDNKAHTLRDDNRKKFKLIDDFERAFYRAQEEENAPRS